MLSRKEKWIAVSIFSLFTLLLIIFRIRTWVEGYGDTAFIYQLSKNIAARGIPVSQLSASIEIMLTQFITAPAKEICAHALTLPSPYEFNYFRWHTYYFLYLLAPLHWIISPAVVLSVMTTLSFMTIAGGSYLALRRKGVPICATAIFCIFLLTHPAWSESFLGQIYADRLFMGLGFLLIACLDFYRDRFRLIAILAVLSTLISERFGITVASLLIGYAVFSFKNFRDFTGQTCKDLIRLCVLGAFCGLISVLSIKLSIRYHLMSSFASNLNLEAFLANLARGEFAVKLRTFLVINLGIFGPFAIFSPRFFLLACGLMIPNIMGDIGGAEKTGFATHYHSIYFPVLAWAALDGFSRINSRLGSRKYVPVALSALFLLISLGTSIGGGTSVNLKPSNLATHSFWTPWRRLWSDLRSGSSNSPWMVQFEPHIPKDAKVTTIEQLMPYFVRRGNDIQYYPIGLADTDFAVLPLSNLQPPKGKFLGGSSFLGPETIENLNSCLETRMKSLGYDVENPAVVNGWAILKRKGGKT